MHIPQYGADTPTNWRRQLTDAEVVTLCVAQVLLSLERHGARTHLRARIATRGFHGDHPQ
jgi:hypothetical protein